MSIYRFGQWRFEPASGEVCRDDGSDKTHLRHQSALVLQHLLESYPAVVSREELRQMLWPGSVVVDFETGISSCLKQVRAALDEPAASPVHIHTIPRRGVRFEAETLNVSNTSELSRNSGVGRWLVGSAVAAALLLAAVLPESIVKSTPQTDRTPQVIAVMPFQDFANTTASAELIAILRHDLTAALAGNDLTVMAHRMLSDSDESCGGVQLRVEGTVRELATGHVVALTVVSVQTERVLWGEIVHVDSTDREASLVILRDVVVHFAARNTQHAPGNTLKTKDSR